MRSRRTLSRPASTSRMAAGFTMIELMVAILILLVGLLSTATLVLGGVTVSLQSKDLATAHQFAKEAMEAVFTARITNNLKFSDLRNQSQGGIFFDTYEPIRSPSPDGLVNTQVYRDQPPLTYVDPGPDDLYGTPDDRIITFDRFKRQVLIATNINGDPNLSQVTINVEFTFKGLTSVVSMTTLMSPIN